MDVENKPGSETDDIPNDCNEDVIGLIFEIAKGMLYRDFTHWGGVNVGEPSEAVIEGITIPQEYVLVIHKVSNMCSGGGDAHHATTMLLLNMLSNYAWDEKVVISLAALAITYGEFWLVVELYAKHPLAKSVAVLKQLPELIEHSNALKTRFDGLNSLIKAMLDVTKRILEFRQLPHLYISPEHPPLSVAMSSIPTAAYWTIRSVIACVQQIASLIGMSYEFITSATEMWELSSLAHKERNIHDDLMQLLSLCHQHIDKMKHEETYRNFIRLLNESHGDNTDVLKHLIYLKADKLPLLRGSTELPVEELKEKNVLLLISELNIPYEELKILDHMYKESRPHLQYEIVWLPIVDNSFPSNEEQQLKYKELQSMMPWYTLQYPELLKAVGIRYIKEELHFENNTIVFVLDPKGNVACKNACRTIFIWGNMAFPFGDMVEESLWKDKVWNLELMVVDAIDPSIKKWIQEGKTICLYGGEDLKWIRHFTKTSKEISTKVGITLELVYVGKSNIKESMKEILKTIENEKLSHFWPDPISTWHFWTRLEYMLYSRLKLLKNAQNDHILQELKTILSFDVSSSYDGWAIFCHGSSEIIARAQEDLILESFWRFEDIWKERAMAKGFVLALKEDLQLLHTDEHCNRLILPHIEDEISDMPIFCAECNKPMDEYDLLRCCAADLME